MKKINNFIVYDKINRDLSIVLNKFIENNKKNLVLKFNQINLISEYKNYLYTKIVQNRIFNKFYFDLVNKNLEKNYSVATIEEKKILEEILKLNKIKNIKISVNILRLPNKVNFFLTKIFFLILTFFSLQKLNSHKQKKKFFCFSNHRKYDSFFSKLLTDKLIYTFKPNYFLFFFILIFKSKFSPKSINLNSKINYFFFQRHFVKFQFFEYELSKYSFKSIIYFEGDSPDHALISQIGRKKGIKSLCIQWGGVLWNKPKLPFQNFSCDYFFCWGKNYVNKFNKYNKKTIFYNVGNPFLKKKKNLDNKKIIFLVPQKSILFTDEIKNRYFMFLNWLIKNYKNSIQIKCHPKELKNNELIKKDFVSKSNFVKIEENIYQAFKKFSIIVGSVSSAMLEGSRVGLIPIFYLPRSNSRYLWSNTINQLKKISNISLLSDDVNISKKNTTYLLNRNNYKEILKIKKILVNEISLIGEDSRKKIINKINLII